MNKSMQSLTLTSTTIPSPLGPMIAVADEHTLYLLEFIGCRGLEREIEKLCRVINASIGIGTSAPLESIKAELASYFTGTLQEFKTPIHILGTPFQQSVWNTLQTIPYGQTRSYAHQAQVIGNTSAHRAVANANGANQLAIIIPCHRIINSNGKLGGYGGGIDRKQWLINLEKEHHDR